MLSRAVVYKCLSDHTQISKKCSSNHSASIALKFSKLVTNTYSFEEQQSMILFSCYWFLCKTGSIGSEQQLNSNHIGPNSQWWLQRAPSAAVCNNQWIWWQHDIDLYMTLTLVVLFAPAVPKWKKKLYNWMLLPRVHNELLLLLQGQ